MQNLATLSRVLSELNPTYEAIKDNKDQENHHHLIIKLNMLIKELYLGLSSPDNYKKEEKDKLIVLSKINSSLLLIKKTITSAGFKDETIKELLAIFDTKTLLPITVVRRLGEDKAKTSLQSLQSCFSQLNLIIDNKVSELDVYALTDKELLHLHSQEILRIKWESSGEKIAKIKVKSIAEEEQFIYWISEKLNRSNPFIDEITWMQTDSPLDYLSKHCGGDIKNHSLHQLVLLLGIADLLGLKDLRGRYEDVINLHLNPPLAKHLQIKLLEALPVFRIGCQLKLPILCQKLEKIILSKLKNMISTRNNLFHLDLQRELKPIYEINPFSAIDTVKLIIRSELRKYKSEYTFFLPSLFFQNSKLTVLKTDQGKMCWLITQDNPNDLLLALAPRSFENYNVSSLDCIGLMKVAIIVQAYKLYQSEKEVIKEIDCKLIAASLDELMQAYAYSLSDAAFFTPYIARKIEVKFNLASLHAIVRILNSYHSAIFDKSLSLVVKTVARITAMVETAKNNGVFTNSNQKIDASLPKIIVKECEIPDSMLKSAFENTDLEKLTFSIASLLYLKAKLFRHPSTEKLLAEISAYPQIDMEEIILDKSYLMNLYLLRMREIKQAEAGEIVTKELRKNEMIQIVKKITQLFDSEDSWILLFDKAMQDYLYRINPLFTSHTQDWLMLSIVPKFSLHVNKKNDETMKMNPKIPFDVKKQSLWQINSHNFTSKEFVLPGKFIRKYMDLVSKKIGPMSIQRNKIGITVHEPKSQEEYFKIFRDLFKPEPEIPSTPDTAPSTPQTPQAEMED